MMLEEGIPPKELVANQETMWWELSVTVCAAVCLHNIAVHYLEKAQYTRIAIPQFKTLTKKKR